MFKRVCLFFVVTILMGHTAYADEGMATKYVKFWEPVLGDWEMTTEEGGEVLTLKWRLREGTSGLAFLSEILEGDQREDAIHGYDPKEKCWTYTFITTEGYGVAKYRVDLSKHARLESGCEAEMETEITEWDGTQKETSATWQFPAVEKDRIVIVSTDRTENGKSQPNIKSTFKRIKE